MAYDDLRRCSVRTLGQAMALLSWSTEYAFAEAIQMRMNQCRASSLHLWKGNSEQARAGTCEHKATGFDATRKSCEISCAPSLVLGHARVVYHFSFPSRSHAGAGARWSRFGVVRDGAIRKPACCRGGLVLIAQRVAQVLDCCRLIVHLLAKVVVRQMSVRCAGGRLAGAYPGRTPLVCCSGAPSSQLCRRRTIGTDLRAGLFIIIR